jgi:predicted Zn-dependent protease
MRALRPLVAVLLCLASAACETIGNLNFYSDEELEPLSLQAYAEETNKHGQVTSGPQYEMVQRVARRIAAASEESGFKWEARLLKADDVPNAFCLPNGRIAIYTGILPITQTEDGLAVVMGHEVAHAILRHGGKRMTQGTIANIAAAAADAGFAFSEISDESKGYLMAAVGVGTKLTVLSYSRDHEREADKEGLRYAIRAGYDPNEAPKLWERMAQLGGGSGIVWLSTHPPSEERAQTLRELIPVLQEEEKGWQPKSAPTTTPTKSVDPGAVRR